MRIRTIKPEFWHHPVISKLPDDCQLIAIGLLSASDDHGYFRADPSIVRADVAPFRDNLDRIRECLARLSEVGWIEVREHPEQGEIGKIINWSKHQKVDHPRDSSLEAYFLANDSRMPREPLALDQGSGIRDQGRDRDQGRTRELMCFEDVKSAVITVGIPEKFIQWVYDDWFGRQGRDGAGLEVEIVEYVRKRWRREQVEWRAGTHKGNRRVDVDGIPRNAI